MSFPYEDIVNLPHHVSRKHPRMSESERAAQFAPFAALTGHDEAISETARLTDSEMELSESGTDVLNWRHRELLEHLKERPEVTFVYFIPDEKKAGGAYVTKTGHVKKVDDYEHAYILTDGTKIAMAHLLAMDGEIFK